VWWSMRQRCENRNCPCYPRYGGKGITVCDRWKNFDAFYADMGTRPSDKHSIDRIDRNGSYSPENCRWATSQEQNRNHSKNVLLKFKGQTRLLCEWAEIQNINHSTVRNRLAKGWSISDALTRRVQVERRNKRAKTFAQ
jgi:hypothetical protein